VQRRCGRTSPKARVNPRCDVLRGDPMCAPHGMTLEMALELHACLQVHCAPRATPRAHAGYGVLPSAAFLQSAFQCFHPTSRRRTEFMKKSLLVLATLAAFAAHAQTTDTLKKIKDSGAATMGVRESSGALSYTLGDGKFAGFHVEVCQRVLADIQKAQGLAKLDVKYVPVTSQNRIPLVQNGTVDIECGSTTNNATRQKDVSFAVTTYVEEVRIAVKANSGITSIGQLANKKVATTTGTTSVQHLRKHERGASINFEEVFGKDHADSFLLLESGRADAFVMDGQILAGNIAKAKNPADFKIVGEVLSVEPIAIMIRKDDPGFKKAVDDSIKAMMASGEMAKLYDKWFMQPIPPTNTKVGLALSDATKQAWAAPNDKPLEEYLKK
jgi:glutamate/aspartate transport system substrate-binding protein